MRPVWSVTANGADVSSRLVESLISLAITDQSGMESDALELRIADPGRQIEAPALGSILTISLGYAHTGAVPMGRFVLDGYELDLAPRAWSLRAHAADFRASLRTRRTAAYSNASVSSIVSTLAGRHGLTPVVDSGIASSVLERVDQTNESDISFLTRLGQWFDALVTVKQSSLIFARRGRGLTASGAEITPVNLTLPEVTNGVLSVDETETVDAVEARYRDIAAKQDKWVRAGSASGLPGQGSAPENVLRLRGIFSSESIAMNACRAKLTALNRSHDSLRLTLPGRADILAESPVILTGFAAEFDGRWIASRVVHRLDSSGYSVEVEAERPTDRAEVTVEELIPVEG